MKPKNKKRKRKSSNSKSNNNTLSPDSDDSNLTFENLKTHDYINKKDESNELNTRINLMNISPKNSKNSKNSTSDKYSNSTSENVEHDDEEKDYELGNTSMGLDLEEEMNDLINNNNINTNNNLSKPKPFNGNGINGHELQHTNSSEIVVQYKQDDNEIIHNTARNYIQNHMDYFLLF